MPWDLRLDTYQIASCNDCEASEKKRGRQYYGIELENFQNTNSADICLKIKFSWPWKVTVDRKRHVVKISSWRSLPLSIWDALLHQNSEFEDEKYALMKEICGLAAVVEFRPMPGRTEGVYMDKKRFNWPGEMISAFLNFKINLNDTTVHFKYLRLSSPSSQSNFVTTFSNNNSAFCILFCSGKVPLSTYLVNWV